MRYIVCTLYYIYVILYSIYLVTDEYRAYCYIIYVMYNIHVILYIIYPKMITRITELIWQFPLKMNPPFNPPNRETQNSRYKSKLDQKIQKLTNSEV